jgi:DNA-binding TFAR19-related protein (PDSD5 family)
VTTLEATLRRIHDDLTALRVSFALVGGLAVSALTEPRFTRDADFAVAVTGDAEAERLVNALQRRRYTVDTVLEHQATGRLATVRLTRTGADAGPVVDLLFASSGIERELVDAAVAMRLLDDLTLPVARLGHLIALKVLSRDDLARPQDLVDLRALMRSATPSDINAAERSLELISERGYHRGKRLVEDLRVLLGVSGR